MTTTQQSMPDTDDVELRCSVCDHATASHDRISQRYCDATQANALPRKCICTSGPAKRPADRAAGSSGPEIRPVGESMADVVERLMHLFGRRLELSVIVAVARQSWRETHDVAGPSRPGVATRLAYRRLTRLAEPSANP